MIFDALAPQGIAGPDYLLMSGVVLVGALLQGIGGIGFAMFSAPLAGLFFPGLAPGPLLALGGAVSLMSALRERAHVDWPLVGVTLLGRFAGSALAVLVLSLLAPTPIAVLYAVMILAAVALSLAGWQVAPSRTNLAVAGLASGLMGTITSAGAPPFAIAMQRLEPGRLRSTVGCVLAAGAFVSIILLAAVGRFGRQELVLSLWLAPWVVAGFTLSGRLAARISSQGVRRLLLALAGFGAVGILVKTLG
jgi:uncharacterized membrane protein YfcA